MAITCVLVVCSTGARVCVMKARKLPGVSGERDRSGLVVGSRMVVVTCVLVSCSTGARVNPNASASSCPLPFVHMQVINILDNGETIRFPCQQRIQHAELPACIGKLTTLKILDLQGCSQLRRLPASICKLTSLEELDLSGCNGLEKLDLSGWSGLEWLDLSGCSGLE